MIIFGGTGNLTNTKLIPALYHLESANLLPKNFKVIGVARKEFSDKSYCDELLISLKKYSRTGVDDAVWSRFVEKVTYLKANFDDSESLAELSGILDNLEKEWKICFNRIFYLAVAPSFFPVVFDSLKQNKLNEGCAKDANPARIIIENPLEGI